ncbi:MULTISPECIES: sensor histidine kinase [unclassified Oscillibacter]|uniref:sensor histidine kinase n=1 Tax=unclassified Oscillibacter TaxID=2629304 RepID=UPI0025E3EC81|nr:MULTISPECIES: HAMP domain-containing sensor histidine kinase [unclassified Oscillibacter]
MNDGNLLLLLLALAVILLCAALVLLERRNTRNVMKRLSQMLDSTMDGSFAEHTFDESLLSAVESRFNQYLAASSVSARNLAAEKEKVKELLADISHQTKTPIANILLYAQLLEEQNLPEESVVCVAALRGQAEKLCFLIAALLKLSRLETGVITLHPVLNDIAPMVEEAANQLAPKAAQKEIQITVNSTDVRAVFDRKWTTEALCNLLDNAVKYTPSGGSIRISAEEYELFCRVDVADTGIGISEAEQAKVFSRFYRSQTVSEQDGAGIGLYLTRQILVGQEGYIKVTSAPGRGSVFSMFLPRQA